MRTVLNVTAALVVFVVVIVLWQLHII